MMMTKAAISSNVIHGFKKNKMVDMDFVRFPDFDKLFATWRKEPDMDEYNELVECFPQYHDEAHMVTLMFPFLKSWDFLWTKPNGP